MLKHELARPLELFRPGIIDDLMRPWNEIMGNGNWLSEFRASVPAVNIEEQDDNYLLTLAAPGMKKDDFRIDIEADQLTISSEKESEKEERGKRFRRKEYAYSSFSRSFTIPAEVQAEKIDAHYADGILSLKMPKKEQARKQQTSRIVQVN
jgi:HSP20 family protein